MIPQACTAPRRLTLQLLSRRCPLHQTLGQGRNRHLTSESTDWAPYIQQTGRLSSISQRKISHVLSCWINVATTNWYIWSWRRLPSKHSTVCYFTWWLQSRYLPEQGLGKVFQCVCNVCSGGHRVNIVLHTVVILLQVSYLRGNWTK